MNLNSLYVFVLAAYVSILSTISEDASLWSEKRALTIKPQPTLSAAGAFVNDDSLYVIGGCTSSCCFSPIQSFWKFNLSSNEWHEITTTLHHSSIPGPRFGSSAISLSSTSILLYGGMDATVGPLSDIYIYNSVVNEWRFVSHASMIYPLGRSSHSSITVTITEKNYMIIYGGIGQGGIIYSDIWILPVNDEMDKAEWFPTVCTLNSNLPPSLVNTAAIPVLAESESNAKFMLFGGADSEGLVSNELWSVDVSLKNGIFFVEWVKIVDLDQGPSARHAHSAFPGPKESNQFIVYGGQAGTGDLAPFLDDAWLYNINEHVWIELETEENPGPRGFSAFSTDSNGNSIIFGGFGGYFGKLDDRLYNDVWTLSFPGNFLSPLSVQKKSL